MPSTSAGWSEEAPRALPGGTAPVSPSPWPHRALPPGDAAPQLAAVDTPDPPDLGFLASLVKAAQDSATQIRPLTRRFADFDIPAAYRVARRIHRARLAEGWTVAGRKLGFTNAGIWEKYGVGAPVWGYVYEETVARCGDGGTRRGKGPVHLEMTGPAGDLRRFAEPRIEPEIVLGLGEAPPADGGPDRVLAAVEWMALGFEVVQSHFPGWSFGAADTVADGALHGMLVVGPPTPADEVAVDVVAALERCELTLTRDDAWVASGRGSDVLGSPLAALRHLASVLRAQPAEAALRSGELVTTGTLVDAYPLRRGETWRAEVEGIDLGGLAVTF